jgi:peptide/nickel transport system ATP-binding protein
MTTILEITDLVVDFYSDGVLSNSALRGLNLSLEAGKTLGIVGETGCGKTLTGMAIMGLLPQNAVQRGDIRFSDFGSLVPEKMSKLRGSQISVIFQNPHSAFNPVFTIGDQLRLVARKQGTQKSDLEELLQARLRSVGLREPKRVLSSFPHELSGGMLQRCMIAMALISRPKLLIADEPTTALDSTIGQQVLDLMKSLQAEENFAMIFISHDVEVVSNVSDDIAVLYAGKVVEYGPSSEVMENPIHPYTRGLLGAIPSADKKRGQLASIPGNVPSNSLEILGCAFASRCSSRFDACEVEPQLLPLKNRNVACWKVES